jgi:hypothetical protein
VAVVLAHSAAFFLAEPNPHHRQALLAATGHRYWTLVASLAMALLVAGLASLVWKGVRGSGGSSTAETFVGLARRLALVQVLGFVLLEGAERLTVGGSLVELAGEPVLGIGIIAQILTAFVGAALVALLARVVEAIVASRSRGGARAPRAIRPVGTSNSTWSPAHLAVGGLTLRGPPISR